jgi:hypothetical protein
MINSLKDQLTRSKTIESINFDLLIDDNELKNVYNLEIGLYKYLEPDTDILIQSIVRDPLLKKLNHTKSKETESKINQENLPIETEQVEIPCAELLQQNTQFETPLKNSEFTIGSCITDDNLDEELNKSNDNSGCLITSSDSSFDKSNSSILIIDKPSQTESSLIKKPSSDNLRPDLNNNNNKSQTVRKNIFLNSSSTNITKKPSQRTIYTLSSNYSLMQQIDSTLKQRIQQNEKNISLEKRSEFLKKTYTIARLVVQSMEKAYKNQPNRFNSRRCTLISSLTSQKNRTFFLRLLNGDVKPEQIPHLHPDDFKDDEQRQKMSLEQKEAIKGLVENAVQMNIDFVKSVQNKDNEILQNVISIEDLNKYRTSNSESLCNKSRKNYIASQETENRISSSSYDNLQTRNEEIVSSEIEYSPKQKSPTSEKSIPKSNAENTHELNYEPESDLLANIQIDSNIRISDFISPLILSENQFIYPHPQLSPEKPPNPPPTTVTTTSTTALAGAPVKQSCLPEELLKLQNKPIQIELANEMRTIANMKIIPGTKFPFDTSQISFLTSFFGMSTTINMSPKLKVSSYQIHKKFWDREGDILKEEKITLIKLAKPSPNSREFDKMMSALWAQNSQMNYAKVEIPETMRSLVKDFYLVSMKQKLEAHSYKLRDIPLDRSENFIYAIIIGQNLEAKKQEKPQQQKQQEQTGNTHHLRDPRLLKINSQIHNDKLNEFRNLLKEKFPLNFEQFEESNFTDLTIDELNQLIQALKYSNSEAILTLIQNAIPQNSNTNETEANDNHEEEQDVNNNNNNKDRENSNWKGDSVEQFHNLLKFHREKAGLKEVFTLHNENFVIDKSKEKFNREFYRKKLNDMDRYSSSTTSSSTSRDRKRSGSNSHENDRRHKKHKY